MRHNTTTLHYVDRGDPLIMVENKKKMWCLLCVRLLLLSDEGLWWSLHIIFASHSLAISKIQNNIYLLQSSSLVLQLTAQSNPNLPARFKIYLDSLVNGLFEVIYYYKYLEELIKMTYDMSIRCFQLISTIYLG